MIECLRNEQRICFGLPIVESHWRMLQLPPSPFDTYDTFVFADENHICKVILRGEQVYHEYMVDEYMNTDGTLLLPKTDKGKPIGLTASSIQKRARRGMGICYHEGHISLIHHETQRTYYTSSYEGIKVATAEDFAHWVDQWCQETTENDLVEIRAFAAAPKKHCKYAEGDYFRFRINRRLYGYGRILLDYNRMREEKIPFWDIFMGKPLCVGVYHIVTNRQDVSGTELSALSMLPTQMIMDNMIYYGETPIIGNLPIDPREEDYPIHYGKSISCGDDAVCYQQGRRFLRLPGGEEVCSGFRNNGIGTCLRVSLPILQACIAARSNTPYWEQSHLYAVNTDLRNPRFAKKLEAVCRQFQQQI